MLQNTENKAEDAQNVEDMDFEEIGEEVLLNLQNARKFSESVADKPIGELTNTVSKFPVTDSPIIVSDSPHKTALLVLIIDTNILISCLPFIKNILRMSLPGYGTPLLVLPWVVMQEMDNIKDNKWKSYEELSVKCAREAGRFIHERLTQKDSHVIGQTPHEVRFLFRHII